MSILLKEATSETGAVPSERLRLGWMQPKKISWDCLLTRCLIHFGLDSVAEPKLFISAQASFVPYFRISVPLRLRPYTYV